MTPWPRRAGWGRWHLGLALSVGVVLATGGAMPVAAMTPAALVQFRAGVTDVQQGNMNGAEVHFRQAATLDPNDPLPRLRLVDVLQNQGQTREAIGVCQQLVSQFPKDPMMPFTLGNLFEAMGDNQRALGAYNLGMDRAIASPASAGSGGYPYGWLHLARIESQMGLTTPAIEHYQNFLNVYPRQYEARRQLARLYQGQGQYNLAVQQYAQLAQTAPEQFADQLDFAKVLLKQNQPQVALEQLKALEAKDGQMKAGTAKATAEAYQMLGDTERATQYFEQSLSLNPGESDLSLRLADLYRQANRPERVIEHYRKYLQQQPDNTPQANSVREALVDAYVDQKDFTAAARELERVLSTTAKTDDTAAQRYALNKQLAYVYQMKGETGRSIDLYERLLQVSQAQNDLQLRKNLAIAYHQGGQLDKALALYQELAHRQAMGQANGGAGADPALNHDIGALLVSMGDTLYDKGNFAKAFEQYQTAVSYDSASVLPFMGMANAALAQQQYGIASDNYQQVLTRDANNAKAMAGLGQIALHQQNYAEAIERFQALAFQQPQEVSHWVNLAESYQALNDPSQALLVYKRVPAELQSDPLVLLGLGHCYQNLNQSEQAIATYLDLVQRYPVNALGYYNLAIAYDQGKQLDKSLAAYQKSLALDAKLADAWYGQGVIYEKQKQYQQAANAYQTYLTSAGTTYKSQAQERIQLIQQAFKIKPGSPPTTMATSANPAVKPVPQALMAIPAATADDPGLRR